MKKIHLTLLALLLSFASFATAIITGPTSVCAGSTILLADATPGGTWSSSDPSVLTITSGGSATGLLPGVAVITYDVSGVDATLTVTVDALPAPITGSGSICVGGTTTLAGSGGGVWSSSTPGIVTIGATSGVAVGVAVGVANIQYTLGTGCSATRTVTVQPTPSAYTMIGGGSYCAGGTAHLGLAYGSTGISYQLYDGSTTVGSPVPGANASLDFGYVTTAGTYTAIATSSTTTCSAPMIGSAVVSMSPLPTVYTLTGGGIYCPGTTGAHIELSNSNLAISYQLYLGSAPVGLPVPGTGTVLDFGMFTTPGTYSAIATDAVTGCQSNMTGFDTISFATIAVYTVGGGGTYCTGTGTSSPGADISLGSSDIGLYYQLYDYGVAVGSTVTGTGSALDFGFHTSAGSYTIVATDLSSGCTEPMMGTAMIVVSPSPTVTRLTGGGAYCAGTSGAHIGLDFGSTGINYQLYNGSTPVGIAVPGPGGSIDFGTFTAGGTYTAVATNTTSGCTATMAGSATVSSVALPVVYTVAGGGTYCAGGTGVHITLSGSVTGVSYQLVMGSAPVDTALPGTGSGLDFGTFTDSGIYTVVATNTSTGCTSSMSGSATISVSPLPNTYSVTGGGSYCAGGSGVAVSLSSSDAGIHYQLLNGSAVVGSPVTGTGSAITFGVETAAGSYTVVATDPVTTCDNNMTGSATVVVNPLPAVYAVTGGGSYCAGGTGVHIGLDGSNSGTNYQLYNGTVAVGSAISGTGSVIDFGLETIAGTYAVVAVNTSTLCTNNMSGTGVVSIATSVTPTVAISAAPGTTVCIGTSVTYTAAGTNTGSAPTYEWAINSVTVSSAGATYTYTPVNGDMIEVFMTSSASCASPATVSTSVVATVISTAVTATATEASCGGYYTLTAGGATTYTWAPGTGLSCTACGIPTCSGLTTSGTYTVTGTDTHGCTGTASVSVNFNRISGHINYFGGVSTDVFKVWLIQFDGTDSTITALDSVNSCMDAGIPYYEFSSPATGNYMVKAKLDGTVPGSSGYISTYSYSTPNWYDAATTAHTAGADTMNVSMVYGTVPTGPGFIGGYISSGAGRGTSGDVPVIGMVVYLTDASGHVLTYTYTDATGSYVFPSLANGTYLIYPENYSFHTTPSATIALSPFNETVTGINFRQYNTTGRILPAGATAVPVTTAQEFNIYPNPATGDLFIQWSNKMIGDADVTITDVTGRTVLATTININAASGQSELSVAELKDGIYLISIKSEMSTFNSKVVIQN